MAAKGQKETLKIAIKNTRHIVQNKRAAHAHNGVEQLWNQLFESEKESTSSVKMILKDADWISLVTFGGVKVL